MTRINRRHALTTLGAGSVAAALLGTSDAHAAGTSSPQGGVLVQAALTLEHKQGRKLSGFLETGIRDGLTLCSLVRQHPDNPAVEAVFASPERNGRADGVRVTVTLYSEPVGEVVFSLLHLSATEDASPRRVV